MMAEWAWSMDNGRYDQWVDQQERCTDDGYLKRQDVSFPMLSQMRLLSATPIIARCMRIQLPNRIYLWSGRAIAQYIRHKKEWPRPGRAQQRPMGIRGRPLQSGWKKNGVSWRVYHGATGLKGDVTDNFTDNSLEFFAKYQVAEARLLRAVSEERRIESHTVCSSDDVTPVGTIFAGVLDRPPRSTASTDGFSDRWSHYINKVGRRLLKPRRLGANCHFYQHDENDGLFDHIIPPMPPRGQIQNSTGLVSDDLVDSCSMNLLKRNDGLGPRVPMLILSRGRREDGYVHRPLTILQYCSSGERDSILPEPNISQWRRAFVATLHRRLILQGTQIGMCHRLRSRRHSFAAQPYQIPNVQVMPAQESGTRPARALPYEFMTQCRVEADKISVEFIVPVKLVPLLCL